MRCTVIIKAVPMDGVCEVRMERCGNVDRPAVSKRQ
nr:MAG TPA: hypothetical protein [Caudoviricetes sp.]DAI62642.1 MAG TPA: hypothetical protein [Caudoviricetes sp.]DAM15380.1 MAG TPA: hypothetical protein [Caudoviricetes sp.]DAT81785.1 MAG TPA: hypothetical protein [Caudoviricetes sp.]